ncbi:MAG: peptidoglycan bridge formation glycyltransferase FemA/FemB family protein [bacterium]|nr:peptidoglycan bridge formation glycyltransferase FemA/FemB family protein [bacterium]
MIKIKEVSDKRAWSLFLNQIEPFPYFQSWNWSEVLERLGDKVLRFGVYDPKNNLIGVFLVNKVKAKRGNYLHVRHGPVFLKFNLSHFDNVLNYIKNIAVIENASFIRISPLVKRDDINIEFFKKREFREAPSHNMDAEICWVLDITKSENELLREMRKTHRYLIKKGKTLDIEIIRSTNAADIKRFLPLYSNLSKRKHFVPHKGIAEEFGVFEKDNEAVLFLAKYPPNGEAGKNKIISGALVVYVSNTAIYRHGASSSQYRNIPASYLLQWEAILEAKKRGKKTYNFWGIAPNDSKRHPWQGLTLFKTGFGGQRLEFLHAQDLPLNLWYFKTWAVEYIAKIIKGY